MIFTQIYKRLLHTEKYSEKQGNFTKHKKKQKKTNRFLDFTEIVITTSCVSAKHLPHLPTTLG